GAVAAAENSGNKQFIEPVTSQFKYIKLKADINPVSEEGFLGSPLFWSLFLGPALCIPLLILFGKKRIAKANDVRGNRIRKADRLAKKYLSAARKSLGNQKTFYVALEKALHNYLKAKLHLPTSEMSKDRIAALLREKGVDEDYTSEFNSLLASCEFARYTPSSTAGMNQDYEKAVRVIADLDKQI